jgi:Flp pilus assembly protein TadB
MGNILRTSNASAARRRERSDAGRRKTGDRPASAVKLTGWRRAAAAAAGMAAAGLAAALYYQSPWAGLLFSPLGLYAPSIAERELETRRRRRLREQFKEALHCLVTSLTAGRSVENALLAVPDELKILYPDPNTAIRREFELIRIGLVNGERPEDELRRFASRAGLGEAARLAEVIAVAKRSGGDMAAIVRSSAQLLGEKIEVEREIAVMTAGKRFESRLMMGAPFAFVMLLASMAPDYMAPLYGSAAGYAILTVGLAALAGCAWLIRKFMSIDV